MTKIASAPLPHDEFVRRLNVLKELRDEAGDAYRAASGAILKFAVEYAALYTDVARNVDRVNQLNTALDLDDSAATRLRTIAAQSKQLTAIQKHLPPALEPIYEVTLALKQDESQVLKAIEDKKLTPESRLRDIRSLRRQMSAFKPPRRGQKRKKVTRPGKPMSAVKFTQMLTRNTPRDSAVQFAMEVDAQKYGTTRIGHFVITNVRRAKDGTLRCANEFGTPLPASVPPHIIRAIRKVVG